MGGIPRKPRPIRLNDDEWQLVKRFAQLAKQDIEKARRLLESATE